VPGTFVFDLIKLAIIGDIHRHFSAVDVANFNRSTYDLLLVTGDLADFRAHEAYPPARYLAQIKKPTLFIPGNHDCVNLIQFMAEIKGIEWLAQLGSFGQEKRVARLRQHLGAVTFCGYSCHDFVFEGQQLSIIAARPFSPGGPELRFRSYLRRHFGVDSLQDSVQRLQRLVDQSSSDTLLFLAHNGPSGLGSAKDDIWGCDFREEGGDFGDPDLLEAISYAKKKGKYVAAVIAGHMHHHLKEGGSRNWLVERENTLYINAARVPRIFEQGNQVLHHHLRLTLNNGQSDLKEVLKG